jgi:hypothetical protein
MRREGRVNVKLQYTALTRVQTSTHPISQSLLKNCNHKAPTNKTLGIPFNCSSRHGKCFMCAHPENSGKARRHEMKQQLRIDMRYMSCDTDEY